MRTWKRAVRDLRCGLCGAHITIGAPVLVIEINNSITLHRCEQCVGQAPPDLPPLVERQPAPTPALTRFGPGMLPLDWKRRQSRDPGEEG